MGIEAINIPKGKKAEDVLEPLWGVLNETPKYPAETSTVFRLLRAAGRDFNRSRFEYVMRVEQLEAPSMFAGRYQWDAMSIARAIAICDEKRWWIPGSPIFEKNANAWERARVVMRANPDEFADQRERLDAISYRDLGLGLLGYSSPENRHKAEAFFSLLEQNLENAGLE